MGRTFSLSAFLIQAFLLPSGLQAQNPPPLPELQREHARLENEIEQLEDHSQEASVGLSSLAALEAITQQSVFLASHDAQARLGQLLERARKASTEDLDDELDTSIKNLDLAMSRDLGSLATRFQSHISSQDTGEVTLPGIVRDAVRIPGEVRQEMAVAMDRVFASLREQTDVKGAAELGARRKTIQELGARRKAITRVLRFPRTS